MMYSLKRHLLTRKRANAIIAGVVMLVSGGAALFIGYIIAGRLDAQFTQIAQTSNLSSEYMTGISNTREEVLASFGMVGVLLIIVGAGLLIKGLGMLS